MNSGVVTHYKIINTTTERYYVKAYGKTPEVWSY